MNPDQIQVDVKSLEDVFATCQDKERVFTTQESVCNKKAKDYGSVDVSEKCADSDSDSDQEDEEEGRENVVCYLPVTLLVASFSIFFVILLILFEFSDDWKSPLMIFRGSSFVIALYMLLSVNIGGWEEAGLGPAFRKMFFFDANARSLPKDDILKASSTFGGIWSLGLLLFALTAKLDRSFFLIWSLIVWVCIVSFGLFLCKCSKLTLPQRSSRLWFIRVLFRVVTAPLWKPQFADLWLADQLVSLTQTMMDLEFTICYLFVDYWNPGPGVCDCPKPMIQCIEPGTLVIYIRPLIACLPSYWRCAQCLRIAVMERNLAQLVNAAKYLSQVPVIAFSSLSGLANVSENYHKYHIYMALWIASSIGHSVFVFVWDVVQDWGLCSSLKTGNWILSRRLYYKGKWKYYWAIVIDLFLRFSWSIKLSIQFGVLQSGSNDFIVATLAMLEVIRRFIWNFFRIENEHSKCDKTVIVDM
jgi:hypothetical protein